MAVQTDFVLTARQAFALGNLDLLADEIHPADHFRHRMFDLEPGIHLDEVELAVLVEEFDRSCAAIAHVGHCLGDTPADFGTLFGRDDRGRGLLDHLLVAALDRTIALAQVDGRAIAVTENLKFDMAGVAEIFLHVDGVVAKGRLGLRRRLHHQALELVFVGHHFHASTTSA